MHPNKRKQNANSGKIVRSTPPPPSPNSSTSKNVFNQASSSVNVNVPQSTNIPVAMVHPPVQHPVALNMGVSRTGLVVSYNNPPFTPPSTTQPPPSVGVSGKSLNTKNNALTLFSCQAVCHACLTPFSFTSPGSSETLYIKTHPFLLIFSFTSYFFFIL